jgi:hypothetical protein
VPLLPNQLGEAALGALAARWPQTRFYVRDDDWPNLEVVWVTSPDAPDPDEVTRHVEQVANQLYPADRKKMRSVTPAPFASRLAEAVVIVQAWRAGALLVGGGVVMWMRGLVADDSRYDPDVLVLADVDDADLELAQALCAHAGITDEEHWRSLVDCTYYEMRRRIGIAAMECGDAIVIAMGQDSA